MRDWKSIKGFFGKAVEWVHVSGIAIRHCGHPTALYPYYIVGDDKRRTFRNLNAAQVAALDA